MPDLHDGSLLDWQRVFGDPLLTDADFISLDVGKGDEIGPPDLTAKVYLGWTSSPSRIYLGIEILDDVYVGELDGEPFWATDNVELRIDGDRGGGQYNYFVENARVFNHLTAQLYIARANLMGADFSLFPPEHKAWVLDLPHSEAGGAVRMGSPVRLVIELMVTPYDSLDYRGHSFSTVSTLSVGTVIGLDVRIADFDTVPKEYDGVHTVSGERDGTRLADGFREFRLSPSPNAVTRVEPAGWGMVKEIAHE